MKNNQNNRESEKDAILSSDQIDLDIQSDASQKERLQAYLKSAGALIHDQRSPDINLP